MTRRPPILRSALLAAALSLVTVGCGEEYDPFELGETRHEYVSRPDLGAPGIEITPYASPATSSPTDDDLVFLAPKDGEPMNSLLIVDAEGEPVWIHPLGEARSYDLKVQEYQGEPVLTWWRGENLALGYGAGEWVVMDDSYEEIATVTTHGVQEADFHELTLTDDGTALMVSYPKVRRDLTEIGGPEDGYVIDNVIQEVDVESGEVLFEWSALDHIPLTDTRVDVQTAEGQDGLEETPFDYAHVNSVTEDTDGSLLVSARNTHAIYRIDRETGEIDWTLGGSSSDFAMTGGAAFAWQHDAQRQSDGTITLYDNENLPPMDDQSRGLRLELDRRSGTARVVTEYLPPDGRLAESQGNLQVRDNGNVLIGWGQQPYYSEYTADGELLWDAALESGESYRALRLPWVAEPAEPPDLVVEDGTAYVSWNGATEVAAWRFVAGADAAEASEVATVRREGFETAVDVPDEPYVAVEALDADGQVLGSAEA
jgi:Arylsulfotransferase (ASST)